MRHRQAAARHARKRMSCSFRAERVEHPPKSDRRNKNETVCERTPSGAERDTSTIAQRASAANAIHSQSACASQPPAHASQQQQKDFTTQYHTFSTKRHSLKSSASRGHKRRMNSMTSKQTASDDLQQHDSTNYKHTHRYVQNQ